MDFFHCMVVVVSTHTSKTHLYAKTMKVSFASDDPFKALFYIFILYCNIWDVTCNLFICSYFITDCLLVLKKMFELYISYRFKKLE